MRWKLHLASSTSGIVSGEANPPKLGSATLATTNRRLSHHSVNVGGPAFAYHCEASAYGRGGGVGRGRGVGVDLGGALGVPVGLAVGV
jgi:hypothetical protein